MIDKLILNKGDRKELLKDLESIVGCENLLDINHTHTYSNEVVCNLNTCLMSKYNLSQKELFVNFMMYRIEELKE